MGEELGALFGEDDTGRSLSDDAAIVELQDFGVELEGFGDVVGDGEDRNVAAGEPRPEVGDEFIAESGVEGGKWLVQQEKRVAGCGERTGEGDALAFAAGKLGGHLRGEVADAA